MHLNEGWEIHLTMGIRMCIENAIINYTGLGH